MVKHKGLCPSLKRSVEFDVNEVIELKTKRGTKYQVKGDYEGRTCSTFCSKSKAMELKSALGQTTMSAETEDETGQAHQDESVAPIENNVQPLSQGQKPMEDMPIQETVATPITGTSVGVEAIDNLQLNDADALANMATQFDDAPDMVADFEIAPQEPEGDGRSIGNIRPMNEDVPLHAESEDGTGQAHQEEGVAPIETDVQPLAEGQEPMEDMPIQETVATPITNSSVGVEAIDNLQLNDADALANMATQFDKAPEMLADFEISFMQPFGDGQSIGNNTPMNPDVPLHAEDDDFYDDDLEDYGWVKSTATFRTVCSKCRENEPSENSRFCNQCEMRMDAETIEVVNPMDETTLTTPPPVCFVEKIPPVVWENMSVLEQIEYAETGNESLLSCPQCGITKADLRDAGGYCAVSDPEGSEYISSVDCPYQKHFAPSHWLDEEYVVGHVEGDTVEVSERLPARVDMPKMKNPQKGLETMVVPYFIWDKIYTQFNGGITAEPDLSGLNYTLQFHGMMKPKIKNLIKGAEGNHDIMFGSETYTATVLKAEGDGGYYIDSATVRPYGAESKKMCIVCNEKPVDYSHPNTLGSLCSTPKCLHYAFSAETFESPATKEVLTLDEAFPSEWFEVPVIAPESGDERYKNCLDCGNPYLVENIRGYGWEASYSNHRPETNGMCDSSLDFEAETFDAERIKWDYVVHREPKGTKIGKDGKRIPNPKGGWFKSVKDAETFEAEQCKHQSYYRVRHNNDDWEEHGDRFCTTIIKCSDCGVEGEGRTNLSHEETPDRRYTQLWWEDIGYEAETFEADGDDTYFLLYYKDSPEQNRRNQVDEEYWDDWNMLEDYIDDGASKEEALEQFQGLVNLWGKSYPHSIIEAELVEIDGNTGEEKTITSWKANAKEFNVEFDDWADQEMLTHGKDVSFKEWAKEEGKKHGDMDLTDWAEEEEESHDERYGAEEIKHYERLPTNMPDATVYDFATVGGDERERLSFAKKILKEEFDENTHTIISYRDGYDTLFYRIVEKDEIYGAEEGAFYQIEVKYKMEDGWEHYGDYDDKQDAINAYFDIYLEYPEVKLLEVDYEDGYVADEIYSQRNFNLDAETFESPAKQDKPSLKSVGLLLGVGALATYFAPKSMRDFLNRLK